MAHSRPAPSGAGASQKPSSGRPVFFGSRAGHSGRVEKRTAPASENTKRRKQEKNLVPMKVDSEQNDQLAHARPEPQHTTTESSPQPKGRSYRQNSGLTTNDGAHVGDEETEGKRSAVRPNSSQGGQELKSMADLLLDLDRHQNLTIPHNKIIASEYVDNRVYQQMRRLAPGEELTADRVRKNLIDSLEDIELRWKWRTKRSRSFFWNRVCKRENTWMKQLDGSECRDFFLWLVIYFRHGPARGKKKTTDALIQALDRLSALFDEEEDCELDELVGIEARVRLPAEQPADHEQATVSKIQDGISKPVAGNIFRLSGSTNMTDEQLRGIDIEGLMAIVDVGDSRRKRQTQKEAFVEELKADRARIAEEEAKQAARAQAAATEAALGPGPQPTT